MFARVSEVMLEWMLSQGRDNRQHTTWVSKKISLLWSKLTLTLFDRLSLQSRWRLDTFAELRNVLSPSGAFTS